MRGYINRYMILGAFDFIQMSFTDILDITLLGLIIFFAFRWLKGSSAVSIFVAIVSLYLIRVLVSALNMRLIEAILNMVLDVGVLAFIVIFQPELRKFLTRLGNRYMSSPRGKALVDRILGRTTVKGEYREESNNITEACFLCDFRKLFVGHSASECLNPRPERLS